MTPPQIVLKRLNTCTFDEAVQLWNDGFQGYYSDMTQSMEHFVVQLGNSSIHPQHSIVAYVDQQLAGFVLTGIKTIEGTKLAFNGGTGVHPKYRGLGIAKAMMKEAVQVYRDQKINTAILEVVTKNSAAIAAYQSAGFRKVDQVTGMSRNGAFTYVPFSRNSINEEYRIQHGIPRDVAKLPFYRSEAAWSSQWFNMKDGESVIVYDQLGEPVAYALSKRNYDSARISSISLHQFEVRSGRNDEINIMKAGLSAVFSPFDAPCKRSTDNLTMSNGELIRTLQEEGFAGVYEQYVMMCETRRTTP